MIRQAILLIRTTTFSTVSLAILLGVLAGALLLLMSGKNPLEIYWVLLSGSMSITSLPDTLNWAVPVVGMTFVASIPMRAGMLNLGGDGQMLIGGMTAAIVPLYLHLPGPVVLVVSIVAAMVLGGCYGLIAAWGEVARGMPMLVTSLLLNYPAAGATSFLATFSFRDPQSGLAQTFLVPEAARMPVLAGNLNAGFLVMCVVAIVASTIDRRTVIGYEFRMMGKNVDFAKYGGIDPARSAYRLMFASGALAGMVGSIVVLGSHFRFINGGLLAPGYGSSGFMAAVLAGGEPIAAAVAGLFFAALQTGGFAVQRATDVPRVMAIIMQSLIILFLALRGGIRRRR
jgi:simple sugar transport system permease protein